MRAVPRGGPGPGALLPAPAGDDFETVGIDTQETAEPARASSRSSGSPIPSSTTGPGEYADELKTKGVPEKLPLDPEGKVARRPAGPVTAESLDTQVAPMIEGS